jgi:hypothetical protein
MAAATLHPINDELACETQQHAHLVVREHVRDERGRRRQLGPSNFAATSRWMMPAKVEPELADHRHVIGVNYFCS